MKYWIGLLFWLSIATLKAQSPQEDKALVAKAMQLQQEAWNKGDVREFMAYYWNNDSLKFIGKKGITYGWQNTLDNYLKGYPDKTSMGQLTFTLLELSSLSPENMYVIGKWDLQKDKPVGGHFTLLWKKIKGKWLIVCDHTS